MIKRALSSSTILGVLFFLVLTTREDSPYTLNGFWTEREQIVWPSDTKKFVRRSDTVFFTVNEIDTLLVLFQHGTAEDNVGNMYNVDVLHTNRPDSSYFIIADKGYGQNYIYTFSYHYPGDTLIINTRKYGKYHAKLIGGKERVMDYYVSHRAPANIHDHAGNYYKLYPFKYYLDKNMIRMRKFRFRSIIEYRRKVSKRKSAFFPFWAYYPELSFLIYLGFFIKFRIVEKGLHMIWYAKFLEAWK